MSDAIVDNLKVDLEKLIKRYEGKRAKLPDEEEKKKLKRGKLYEFFVLGKVLAELASRGFSIQLRGQVLDLKQSPGAIQPHDAYFVATAPGGGTFHVRTDIEVRTLGSEITSTSSLCSYHEIDIVVVDAGATGRPSYQAVALGVECKSHEKFKKAIVKEVLGVKREISFYHGEPLPSWLAAALGQATPEVHSVPPLEYWLAHIDPEGANYAHSPSAFGIEFKNWVP